MVVFLRNGSKSTRALKQLLNKLKASETAIINIMNVQDMCDRLL